MIFVVMTECAFSFSPCDENVTCAMATHNKNIEKGMAAQVAEQNEGLVFKYRDDGGNEYQFSFDDIVFTNSMYAIVGKNNAYYIAKGNKIFVEYPFVEYKHLPSYNHLLILDKNSEKWRLAEIQDSKVIFSRYTFDYVSNIILLDEYDTKTEEDLQAYFAHYHLPLHRWILVSYDANFKKVGVYCLDWLSNEEEINDVPIIYDSVAVDFHNGYLICCTKNKSVLQIYDIRGY